MAQISNASAFLGLVATGTAEGTNISGSVTIGKNRDVLNYQSADIAYSFKVTATGAADRARLTLSTGVVTQEDGGPTIEDGDGKDFEGATLGTATGHCMVYLSAPSDNSGTLTYTSSDTDNPTGKLIAGSDFDAVATFSRYKVNGHLDLTFAAIGDTVTVTVLAQTT